MTRSVRHAGPSCGGRLGAWLHSAWDGERAQGVVAASLLAAPASALAQRRQRDCVPCNLEHRSPLPSRGLR